MIVPIPRSQRTSEENVLPLINIVFLLLIFFMVAGALSVTAPFPIDLPETRAAEPTDAPAAGVSLSADGRLAFAGEEVEEAELAERVALWREAAGPDELLSLRADQDARTGDLQRVLDILRAAEVDSIRLLSVGSAESD